MPHTIRRRKGTFQIFTEAEAGTTGLDYVPLREINGPTPETGIWALVDDGYVAEVLTSKMYTDQYGSTKTFIRLSFGAVWIPRKKPFCFLPFLEANSFGGTRPRSWIDREARSERARRAIRTYVAMTLSPAGVDWDRLGRIYRPDPRNPAKIVRKLLRQEKIQALIHKEMRTALSGYPISLEEIVNQHKRLLEAALKEKDLAIARDILSKFCTWLGI